MCVCVCMYVWPMNLSFSSRNRAHNPSMCLQDRCTNQMLVHRGKRGYTHTRTHTPTCCTCWWVRNNALPHFKFKSTNKPKAVLSDVLTHTHMHTHSYTEAFTLSFDSDYVLRTPPSPRLLGLKNFSGCLIKAKTNRLVWCFIQEKSSSYF